MTDKAEQIRELELDRQGYVDGLGADDASDKAIKREIKKIDKKLAALKGTAA